MSPVRSSALRRSNILQPSFHSLVVEFSYAQRSYPGQELWLPEKPRQEVSIRGPEGANMTEHEVDWLLQESQKPSAQNRGRPSLNQEQSSLKTTSVTLCTTAGRQLREDLRFSCIQTTDRWFTQHV